MFDIVIIGAGPAGMSAAIYGKRAGRSVLVLEENCHGGQIVNTSEVENYPGIKNITGFDFAMNLYNQIIDLGAEVRYQKVLGIKKQNHSFLVNTNKDTFEAKAIIIATGVKKRNLGIDSEESFVGKGVSYCATCDGMFYKDKDVAVVGGGNTALEDALFLSQYCRNVYIIHRRDEFRGEKNLELRLREKSNVKMILDSVVEEIKGQDKLEEIQIRNLKDNTETNLSIDGLFVAVGQAPDNSAFKGFVDLDDSGFVIAGEDCKTSADGIFVAGDCRTKGVRQLTTAASDGAIAGLAACKYIEQI